MNAPASSFRSGFLSTESTWCPRGRHSEAGWRRRLRRRAHPLRPRPPLLTTVASVRPSLGLPTLYRAQGFPLEGRNADKCAPERRAGGSGSWEVEFVVWVSHPTQGRHEGRPRSTPSAPGASTHPQQPPRHGARVCPPRPPPARGSPAAAGPRSSAALFVGPLFSRQSG